LTPGRLFHFEQPFVVVSDRVSELFLGREECAAGLLGVAAGSVENDVVF
jgi:hypothetical protein